MSYEMNVVYVWISESPDVAYLKGTECMITGAPRSYIAANMTSQYGWPTDSPGQPGYDDDQTWAFVGDLRRKNSPTGEQSILDQFKLPAPQELEPA